MATALQQPKQPAGGGFGQFAAEKRPEFSKQCEGKPVSAVSKLAGEAWKALPDAEKAPYNTKFDEAKKKYVADMEAFLASGGVKTKGVAALRTEKRKAKEDACKEKKDVLHLGAFSCHLQKKKKDVNAPKKPAGGAYGCFMTANREALKKECPGSIADVAKLAGERWKALPEAEKEQYIKEYETKLSAHKEAMKSYVPPVASEKIEPRTPPPKKQRAARASNEKGKAKKPEVHVGTPKAESVVPSQLESFSVMALTEQGVNEWHAAPAAIGDNVVILDFLKLHGKTGVVSGCPEGNTHLEVRMSAALGSEEVPFANLKKIELGEIDCAEVHSLTSDSGMKLNGQVGVVTRYVVDKDRFEIRIAGEMYNLKAANLNKFTFPPPMPVSQPSALGIRCYRSSALTKAKTTSSVTPRMQLRAAPPVRVPFRLRGKGPIQRSSDALPAEPKRVNLSASSKRGRGKNASRSATAPLLTPAPEHLATNPLLKRGRGRGRKSSGNVSEQTPAASHPQTSPSEGRINQAAKDSPPAKSKRTIRAAKLGDAFPTTPRPQARSKVQSENKTASSELQEVATATQMATPPPTQRGRRKAIDGTSVAKPKRKARAAGIQEVPGATATTKRRRTTKGDMESHAVGGDLDHLASFEEALSETLADAVVASQLEVDAGVNLD